MKHSKLVTLFALLMALLMAFGCAAPAASAPEESQKLALPETVEAETVVPAEEPEEEPAPAREPLSVVALKGPTGMGLVKLMEQAAAGNSEQPYHISLAASPDEVVGQFVSKEVDIAAIPINLAAALYKKTEGNVNMIAVNTLGVLYVLENGNTLTSLSDLAGKTLGATGQGSTPEYILNYLLEQNGIRDDVTVEYYTEHAELASLLAENRVSIGLLPEPNVTATMLKNQDLRIALDLTKEWDAVSGGTKLVQGCIIAQKELVENDPNAVEKFLKEYADSVAFVNENPQDAGALIEQFGIMGSAAAAAKAIPNANIVCLTGKDMQQSAKAMLEVLFAADPKSVGGAVPDDGLFYIG